MKALDPVRVANLADRAARLGQLKDHDSWAELRTLFEERRAKHYKSLTDQLMAGSEIDQRYVDRTAGFFKGAQWILDNPDLAESSLASALRKAELLAGTTERGT